MSDEPWTLLRVLRWTHTRFGERALRSPRLDAEVLLAHTLKMDRVGLYTHYDQPLTTDELARFRELIRRRLSGEPVAYLVGRQEFWSLPFAVDERVLVPRPETELVVATALAALTGRPQPRIVDVGTGSGAIAIAVAHERPDAEVIAIDRSPAALDLARDNAERNEVDVEFVVGDLLEPVATRGPFAAILSNPPYIADGDFPGLPPEVRREPREALLGGPDGLDVIRRLVAAAPSLLSPGGLLALEVGAGHASSVSALMSAAGLVAVTSRKDLAGIERVVTGTRP